MPVVLHGVLACRLVCNGHLPFLVLLLRDLDYRVRQFVVGPVHSNLADVGVAQQLFESGTTFCGVSSSSHAWRLEGSASDTPGCGPMRQHIAASDIQSSHFNGRLVTRGKFCMMNFCLWRSFSLRVRRRPSSNSPWDRHLRCAYDPINELLAPLAIRRLSSHRSCAVDALLGAHDVLAAARVEAQPDPVLVPVVVAALLQHVVGPEVDDFAELARRHDALVSLHLVQRGNAVIPNLVSGDVHACMPH